MQQKPMPTVQQQIDHLNKIKDRIAVIIAELEKAKAMLHTTRELRHKVASEVYSNLNASDDKIAEVERQLESVFSRTRIRAIETLIELCEARSSSLITEIKTLSKNLPPDGPAKKNTAKKAANEEALDPKPKKRKL